MTTDEAATSCAAPQGREALNDDEIGTLQAAVENLRSPDKAEERTIEAAWRIASKLEQIVKRAFLTPAVAPDAGAGEATRREIAGIIDGTPFRPAHINGPFKDETEKEKWLRARNVAFYKADTILATLAQAQEPGEDKT